ncbi:unnamed protein product [Closterium sp. NIES-64]|nr:unnamed protein product [Closterium sp. NIES-64]CAI6010416.1 unnamed protein product [Closterium sp. NIES-65]
MDSPESNKEPVPDATELDAETPSASVGNANKKQKGKAVKQKKKRKVWTEDEMTDLATARWFTREDLKSMQGKQGSQYCKKLRRHLCKANPNRTRKSGAMKQQWKRLEREYKEICEALAMSGGGNIARPGWFGYMEELRAGTAAVNPHVVDGGGAGEDHADPLANPMPPAPAPATPMSPPPQVGPSGLTPAQKADHTTPVRKRRVSESATICGAQLIADALKECSQEGLAKLDALTRLIMSAVASVSAPPEAADPPAVTASAPPETADPPPETPNASTPAESSPMIMDPTGQ